MSSSLSIQTLTAESLRALGLKNKRACAQRRQVGLLMLVNGQQNPRGQDCSSSSHRTTLHSLQRPVASPLMREPHGRITIPPFFMGEAEAWGFLWVDHVLWLGLELRLHDSSSMFS